MVSNIYIFNSCIILFRKTVNFGSALLKDTIFCIKIRLGKSKGRCGIRKSQVFFPRFPEEKSKDFCRNGKVHMCILFCIVSMLDT